MTDAERKEPPVICTPHQWEWFYLAGVGGIPVRLDPDNVAANFRRCKICGAQQHKEWK
jgi:hypothetical protein